MPSRKSNTATRFCKVCHKPIGLGSFHALATLEPQLCTSCYLELKPSFVHWRWAGVPCLAIYPYRQAFQSMLYLYKGCGDIELAPAFLAHAKALLRLRYWDYVLVAAPSHQEKIEARGFDHIPLVFGGIGKGFCPALIKTKNVKQSDMSKAERKKIKSALAPTSAAKSLKGKKVLLVDDVFTTGSTIKACVGILRSFSPKCIRVLVLAKVPLGRKGM